MRRTLTIAKREFIGYFNQGGLVEPATVRRSMELFARDVMPHCR